jgi:hypothetical protein
MIPGMAFAALAAWLVTEGLGAWMLSRWVAHGGLRRAGPSPGVPPPIVLSHAGLAFTGFLCWVGFLASGSAVPAWIALGLLAPAIGLGISTVTIWTPYPVASPSAAGRGPAARLDSAARPRGLDPMDALVLQLLAPPTRKSRSPGLAPLVPAAHGVSALVTFLFAMLAAIAAL